MFTAQRNYINKHNLEAIFGLHSYDLAINEFADLTHEEFLAKMTMKVAPHQVPEVVEAVDVSDLPETVDWRRHNMVSRVKDQGECGSCWAFSAIGSIEGAHAKATGELISLSEQQLVDCEKVDHGCNGGSMVNGLKYVIEAGGADTEKSYPYTAKDGGECKFNKNNVAATISNYKRVKQGSEADLQKAVAEVGPIAIGMDASHMSFQFYFSGVYDPKDCSSTKLDHGVLAVGYGHEKGGIISKPHDYWLVKNSWGRSWGMAGYVKMVRNNGNKCGVATSASYPIV